MKTEKEDEYKLSKELLKEIEEKLAVLKKNLHEAPLQNEEAKITIRELESNLIAANQKAKEFNDLYQDSWRDVQEKEKKIKELEKTNAELEDEKSELEDRIEELEDRSLDPQKMNMVIEFILEKPDSSIRALLLNFSNLLKFDQKIKQMEAITIFAQINR